MTTRTRQREGAIQRMTDDELRALARRDTGPGGFGERSQGDLARMELARRQTARDMDERYRARREERARALARGPVRPDPLARLSLLGHPLTDQDLRDLRAFVRAAVEEEIFRIASVSFERGWADDEEDEGDGQ